jgi:hypothetical protein
MSRRERGESEVNRAVAIQEAGDVMRGRPLKMGSVAPQPFPRHASASRGFYFFFRLRFFPFFPRFFFLILMLQVLFQLTFAMLASSDVKGILY